MGWKSTIDITREEAIQLIMDRIILVSALSNKELEDMIESMGYGDDTNLPYYGYNFLITNGKNKTE